MPMHTYVDQVENKPPEEDQANANATLCLTIPGKVLHLTALLTIRKFRKKGDKEGALAGFRALEKANLGMVEAINPRRGTSVVSTMLEQHVLYQVG